MMPKPLDCIELVELVTDYLEGRMSATDRKRFEAHLAECEGCVANVNQMKTTVQLLSEAPAEALSPEVSASIRALFEDWTDSRRVHDET